MVDVQTYVDRAFLLKMTHEITSWSMAHIVQNPMYFLIITFNPQNQVQ
jgi:hypothetical protein